MIAKRKILKIDFRRRKKAKKEDFLAIDKPINIFVNGNYFVTLMASPRNIRELAIGHLLGQGIINALEDIEHVSTRGKNVNLRTKAEIQLEATKFPKVIPTACGTSEDIIELLGKSGVPKLAVKFSAENILNAFKSFHSASRIFKKSGGTHAAALFTRDGKFKFCMEDVGRHNAVDKVIGRGLIEGVNFTRSFMISTGRLSADMVIKCAIAGIPLVASRAAPLESGVLVAEMSGLTLVGFVRGYRLNVYTRPRRVKL